MIKCKAIMRVVTEIVFRKVKSLCIDQMTNLMTLFVDSVSENSLLSHEQNLESRAEFKVWRLANRKHRLTALRQTDSQHIRQQSALK